MCVEVNWPTPKVLREYIIVSAVKSNQIDSTAVEINAKKGIEFPDFSNQPNHPMITDIYEFNWQCKKSNGDDCNNVNLSLTNYIFNLLLPKTSTYTITLGLTDKITQIIYNNLTVFQIDPSKENAFKINIIQPQCFKTNGRSILTVDTPDLTFEETKILIYNWNVTENGIQITNANNVFASKKQLLLSGDTIHFNQSSVFVITVTVSSPLSVCFFFFFFANVIHTLYI